MNLCLLTKSFFFQLIQTTKTWILLRKKNIITTHESLSKCFHLNCFLCKEAYIKHQCISIEFRVSKYQIKQWETIMYNLSIKKFDFVLIKQQNYGGRLS